MLNRKPAWWQLYLLVPFMAFLLGIEYFAPLPDMPEEVVVAGIVGITFAAMLGWMYVNGGLMEWHEIDDDASYSDYEITVYEPTSRTNEEDSGPNEPEKFAISRPIVSVRGEGGTRLKEEGKWLLN